MLNKLAQNGGIKLIEEIIEKYRQYIKDNHLTQQEGADLVHISRTHLSRILNKERAPSMALLIRMESVIKNGYSSKL